MDPIYTMQYVVFSEEGEYYLYYALCAVFSEGEFYLYYYALQYFVGWILFLLCNPPPEYSTYCILKRQKEQRGFAFKARYLECQLEHVISFVDRRLSILTNKLSCYALLLQIERTPSSSIRFYCTAKTNLVDWISYAGLRRDPVFRRHPDRLSVHLRGSNGNQVQDVFYGGRRG